MYKWYKIKTMRANGSSIKGIARELKLSKNTVRKYLRSSDAPKFNAREYEKKLDPYEEQINNMLEKDYIGTRIYNEIQEVGYDGSLSGVHRYIQGYSETEKNNRLSTTRVETPPAHQMQYDWKEWYLPVDGKEVKVYIHGVVLGYSRMKHYSFSLSITCQDVIRAIESAIHFFGGAAKELIFDNPKQMVITHCRDGVVRYNDEFLKFCGLYGIEPSACQNYRARTKGKVERPFYYLQEHLLRGLSVSNLMEFENNLQIFTEEYNSRIHSKLGVPPQERFKEERKHLKEIMKVEPTVLYERESRKISNDGYVSFSGGLYPVPMRLCGKDVLIESVFGRTLNVYEMSGMLVSEHEIHVFEDGLRPEHPEHKEMNQAYKDKKEAVYSALLVNFVSLFGETGRQYIEGLRKAVNANIYWHIKEIMACCEIYYTVEIERVLKTCIEIGSYHKNTVLRLLDHTKAKTPTEEPILSCHTYPKENITRDMSAYAFDTKGGRS